MRKGIPSSEVSESELENDRSSGFVDRLKLKREYRTDWRMCLLGILCCACPRGHFSTFALFRHLLIRNSLFG